MNSFQKLFYKRRHKNSRKQNFKVHECNDFLEISGENITETDAIKLSSERMHFYELKGEKYELQKSPNIISKHILETQQTRETKEKHFQLSKQSNFRLKAAVHRIMEQVKENFHQPGRGNKKDNGPKSMPIIRCLLIYENINPC